MGSENDKTNVHRETMGSSIFDLARYSLMGLTSGFPKLPDCPFNYMKIVQNQ